MTIDISDGVRLSDKDAYRIMHRMLDDLETVQNRLDAYVADKGWEGSLGNPKGQLRAARRLEKVLGSNCLAVSLLPGHRCKFSMIFWLYQVDRGGEGGRRRLSIVTMYVRGLGPGGGSGYEPDTTNRTVQKLLGRVTLSTEVQTRYILAFSEHALARMIKRSMVRRDGDYLQILRDIAPAMLLPCLCVNEGGLQGEETWPLPITLPGGDRAILLVRARRLHGTATVASVYPGVWRDHREIDELARLIRTGRTADDDASVDARIAEGIRLFRAAARYFN